MDHSSTARPRDEQDHQRAFQGRYGTSQALAAHPDAEGQARAATGHSAVVAGGIEERQAMSSVQQRNAKKHMQYGLPVAMAISIDEALVLLSQGRVAAAVDRLKSTLLYATITDPAVHEAVGTENCHESSF